MTKPRRNRLRLAACLVLLLAPFGSRAGARADTDSGCQVTLFAVVATPDGATTDPRLLGIVDQLRKLEPGHGFELQTARGKRLEPGESLVCELGSDLAVIVKLESGPDPAQGKLRLALTFERDGKPELTTTITMPTNQLFFCEKPLPDGARLLIGIGAR